MRVFSIITLCALFASGCTTYRDVKEIKMLGFSDDVSKGQSVGQFESDDCVYHVMGYSLGTNPNVSRAIANARTRKKSNVVDVIHQENANSGKPIRYATNIEASNGGFDAVVFGKRCVVVRGVGYL